MHAFTFYIYGFEVQSCHLIIALQTIPLVALVLAYPKTALILTMMCHKKILRAIEELKKGSGFGSIEIVLHEGRVTQIEKREKLRFTHTS